MSRLATQQQALLEALFARPAQAAVQRLRDHASGVGAHPQRGLLAYQSNGRMLAERALRAVYPVLVQLLGEDSFAGLARALWHAQPPQCGDIAEWGDGLAEFMGGSVQLQDAPYLPDVARAEWALHRCALAPDRAPLLASLALLTREDPQTLSLELAPGWAVLSSNWPLASLLLAHLQGTPTLAELALQLHDGRAQDIVLWRAGYQPQLRQALPGELPLLRALQDGVALEPALDASPQLDFSQWLPLAVQTGLVLGARHCSPLIPESTP
jgi:hypothetical protein